jgi:hypothetical protein
VLTHVTALEQRAVSGPPARVVVDGPQELEGERLGLEVVQERELLLEIEELLVGPREEEVREVADVGEAERLDLRAQLRVELAHPPHPGVLERVVLGATITWRLRTASTTGE